MPDSSLMLALCRELNIMVNDLLSGETVTRENDNKELENNLLEMIMQKELADKRLLTIEFVMCIVCIFPLLAAAVMVAAIPLEEWVQAIIVAASIVPLLIAMPFALKIEQTAGYYVCRKCGHRYIPKYNTVFWAMHIGRTRYMKCPKCKKKSEVQNRRKPTASVCSFEHLIYWKITSQR